MIWGGGFEGISIWRVRGQLVGISIGGGVRYNFDWEGWGAKGHNLFATWIGHFVNNDLFMALLH